MKRLLLIGVALAALTVPAAAAKLLNTSSIFRASCSNTSNTT
ncbi:hypothetical protein QO002_002786 [Pararhizobium capsulatum DSM 1112]|uniref:Uncharacterized protein n=1 Tax=Pararhizobium capsulatum DSM 1112 TaxID=1121113 RepID=A0ABU0BRR4_9HYPH|nr:hypothetical protein [Pararhizobium capsulatum]MDQ0320648.1 hypothetical protein [Pararhizobium capsulatum DSM 1112]